MLDEHCGVAGSSCVDAGVSALACTYLTLLTESRVNRAAAMAVTCALAGMVIAPIKAIEGLDVNHDN